MQKILLIVTVFVLMSCVSKPVEYEKTNITAPAISKDDSKVTVTGTRISREDAKKFDLKPLGTLGELLNSKMAGIPQATADKTCKDILKELEDKNIRIFSVTDSEVIAITPDKTQLQYTFNQGGCL